MKLTIHAMIMTSLLIAQASGDTSTSDKGTLKAGEGGIAWHGTWKSGLAIAKKSGRPILLIAAAPHCRNVSGMW